MIALTRVPFARVARSPRSRLTIAAWTALAVAVAIVDRNHSAGHGANGALLHTFAAITLPLLALGVTASVANGEALGSSGRALVALGAAPMRVAAASVFTAMVVSAAVSVLVGVVVLLVAGTDRPLGDDLLTTAWVAALGGSAYASLFALGSTFGRRGGGRTVFLVLDWLVGSGHATSSVFVPRAHVRSLLGGVPAHDLPQHVSVLVLVAIAVLCGALAIRRAR